MIAWELNNGMAVNACSVIQKYGGKVVKVQWGLVCGLLMHDFYTAEGVDKRTLTIVYNIYKCNL